MKTMKMIVGGAIAALTLAGASVGVGGAANAAVSFFVGPNGAHIGFSSGSWYDARHHRHYYTYPSDWQAYHHPLAWYRSHPHWREPSHHDWYRG